MRYRMYHVLTAVLGLSLLAGSAFADEKAAGPVYELRTYVAKDGKLDVLIDRFRNHTVGIFSKHGIKSIGYWVPTDAPASANTLIYVIEHASREAADKSWASFREDADWKKVTAMEKYKGLLAGRPESVYMTLTDYSPALSKSMTGDGDADAVFELRVYTAAKGKLDDLNARFRDHTTGIFERHGIHNIAYWTPMDEPQSANTLIYIVRHPSRKKAAANWRAFGQDADWQAARRKSEENGRLLAERPQSTYMRPTDFSAIK